MFRDSFFRYLLILVTITSLSLGGMKSLGELGSSKEKPKVTWRSVDLREAKRLYNEHSALFIDARPFSSYQRGTIARSLNLPLRRFKRMSRWLPADKGAALLIFANEAKNNVAQKVAKRLIKTGYRDVMVYDGGYLEWKRHNLPIMAAPQPCRCDQDYHPKQPPIMVDGVALYLDLEDESRIDAKWIAPLLVKGVFPNGMSLVDVRRSSSFAKGHLPRAINIPFDEERMELNISALPPKGPILFTCKHGSISADAWFSLPENLQKRVFILDADVICKQDKCSITPH